MLKREGKKTEKELIMIWGLFCKKCAFLNTTISPTLHMHVLALVIMVISIVRFHVFKAFFALSTASSRA